jgi:hypothetical protein
MAGNGDERERLAWGRVEAKLDRLAEAIHRRLLALEGERS